MKYLTELVSRLRVLLKDIYPYAKGHDHIRSVDKIGPAFLINFFDHRCYEGIEIKVRDIAPEMTSKNVAAEPKPCLQQQKMSS